MSRHEGKPKLLFAFIAISHSVQFSCCTKRLMLGYAEIIFVFFVGVSCDSCLKNNFRGRRYKCLICYDYDLCAACYEAGATNTRHTTDHAMQCILTRADFGKHHLTVINTF